MATIYHLFIALYLSEICYPCLAMRYITKTFYQVFNTRQGIEKRFNEKHALLESPIRSSGLL